VDVDDVGGLDRDVGSSPQPSLRQRRMNCASSEDRWNRQAVEAEFAVRQDEQLDTAARGVDRVGGEAVQRRGKPTRAIVR
jgi:hypothetical protein